jgi:SPP1 gp7 family putative phage head morphogenesis protein
MAGITGESRARMESIARTEMNRASREATRRTYAENGDVLNGYIRLATNSTRTCAACWALSGTKHATSDIMPSHPQCRCVMVPDTKSLAEITGDDSIPDERPQIPYGPDLFATLSEADQIEVLGPGRFEQYKAGAPLSSFVHATTDSRWGPTVTVAPLTESAARMPVGATP